LDFDLLNLKEPVARDDKAALAALSSLATIISQKGWKNSVFPTFLTDRLES
jgi:hypothetical protein